MRAIQIERNMAFVVYGTGSRVISEVEESAHRLNLRIVAGVKNQNTESFLSSSVTLHSHEKLPDDILTVPFLVPIFTPGFRQAAAEQAFRAGFVKAFTLLDPTIISPRSLECGPGSYVNAGVIFGASCRLEEFVFINRGASIGHHANIGRFVSIGPSAVVAGNVTIGYGAMIGAGATILPALSVGNNAVVGAGAVVTSDVPEGRVVMGSPARVTKVLAEGYRGIRVT